MRWRRTSTRTPLGITSEFFGQSNNEIPSARAKPCAFTWKMPTRFLRSPGPSPQEGSLRSESAPCSARRGTISLMITTVLGQITPQEAGFTLSHEHLMCDLWRLFPSYDNILDDECLAEEELCRYRDAGGGAVVDCTSVGLGRNPEALRRI